MLSIKKHNLLITNTLNIKRQSTFIKNFFSNKSKSKGLFHFAEDLLLNIFNKASEDKNPQQQLEQNECNEAIRNAIDALPEKQRTAFVLSKYDDLTQKEIATIMQSTEGSVEQLLQRAKSNLQKKLSLQLVCMVEVVHVLELPIV